MLKKTKIIIASACSVVVVGLGIVCFILFGNNTVKINKSTKKDYFRTAIEKDIYKKLDGIEKYLKILDNYDFSNIDTFSTMTISFEELGTQILSDILNFDLTWVNNAKIDLDSNIKNKDTNVIFGLGLNDTDLFSFDIRTLPSAKKLYIGSDLLNKGIIIDDTNNALKQNMNNINLLKLLLPNKKMYNKIFKKYVDIFFDGLSYFEVNDDAKISISEYEDDLVQKCTSIKCIISEDEIENIINKICEQIPNDKDLKQYISSIINLLQKAGLPVDLESEDVSGNVIDFIEESLSAVTPCGFIAEIELDDSDDIISFWIIDENNDFSTRYVDLVEGENIESLVQLSLYDVIDVQLLTKGTYKNGIINSVTSLNYGYDYDYHLCDIELKDYNYMDFIKQKKLEGKITITNLDELFDYIYWELDSIDDNEYEDLIAGLSCDIDMKSESINKSSIEFLLRLDDKPLMNVNLDSNISKAKKIELPKENVVNMNEITDIGTFITQNMKAAELMTRITSVNIPDELLSSLLSLFM